MDPVTALLGIGEAAIDKIWPDADEAEKRKLALASMAHAGNMANLEKEVKSIVGQLEINKIDSASGSKFQAWWRPAVGWVGAVSLALMYIPKAIVMTYIWTYQSIVILSRWNGEGEVIIPSFPDLGVSDIIGLLMSMLGIAAMRSYDKKQGTDTKK